MTRWVSVAAAKIQEVIWVSAFVYLPSTSHSVDIFQGSIDEVTDAIVTMRRKAGPRHRLIAGGDFNTSFSATPSRT